MTKYIIISTFILFANINAVQASPWDKIKLGIGKVGQTVGKGLQTVKQFTIDETKKIPGGVVEAVAVIKLVPIVLPLI